MSRWIVRLIGVLVILIFMIILTNMQRRLTEMQQQRPAPTRSR